MSSNSRNKGVKGSNNPIHEEQPSKYSDRSTPNQTRSPSVDSKKHRRLNDSKGISITELITELEKIKIGLSKFIALDKKDFAFIAPILKNIISNSNYEHLKYVHVLLTSPKCKHIRLNRDYEHIDRAIEELKCLNKQKSAENTSPKPKKLDKKGNIMDLVQSISSWINHVLKEIEESGGINKSSCGELYTLLGKLFRYINIKAYKSLCDIYYLFQNDGYYYFTQRHKELLNKALDELGSIQVKHLNSNTTDMSQQDGDISVIPNALSSSNTKKDLSESSKHSTQIQYIDELITLLESLKDDLSRSTQVEKSKYSRITTLIEGLPERFQSTNLIQVGKQIKMTYKTIFRSNFPSLQSAIQDMKTIRSSLVTNEPPPTVEDEPSIQPNQYPSQQDEDISEQQALLNCIELKAPIMKNIQYINNPEIREIMEHIILELETLDNIPSYSDTSSSPELEDIDTNSFCMSLRV